MEDDRFTRKITKTSTCWLWTGARVSERTYGIVHRSGKNRLAHRWAWELAYGPIPDGQCVCHRCDNPPCVRPAHLFLGTKAENTYDRHAKQRDAVGERNGSRTHPELLPRGRDHWRHRKPHLAATGQRHGMAKLTDGDVLAIRARSSEQRKLVAAEYGVSRSLISQIVLRQIWRHLP